MTQVYKSTALGVKQKKYANRDVSKVTHLVLHITGVGIYRREEKFPNKNPLQLAEFVYTNIMSASAHELVGDSGVCILCPETLAAHHVGGPKHKALNPIQPWHKKYLSENAGAKECVDSAWGMGSVNKVSYGIELVSPKSAVSGMFTDRQLANLVERINDILSRIPTIKYVTSHSVLSPATRSTHAGPWDLSLRLSKQVLEALAGNLARPVGVFLG